MKGYNAASSANQVDGDAVPVPHFGAALSVQQFHDLAKRLTDQGTKFIIEPHLRFQGAPGEQVRASERFQWWGTAVYGIVYLNDDSGLLSFDTRLSWAAVFAVALIWLRRSEADVATLILLLESYLDQQSH